MSLPIVQSYTYITDDILHVFVTTLIEQLADSYFSMLMYIMVLQMLVVFVQQQEFVTIKNSFIKVMNELWT